jgi:dTDP-4-amino-4,6-dideoxygalactose transaminase
MKRRYISFHRPTIGAEEIREVARTLRSGWVTTGPRTAQFELEFKQVVQAEHALAVNSGTAALHIALVALGLGPHDEVITTPLTFCATVNVILQTGATAVLADVGEDGNIDPESIAQRIGPRTRAIIPVHLGGLACNMEAIWRLARKHGLYVIEDAAHAMGTRYQGKPIGAGDPRGNHSDAVAFSFYATKSLTTGEGGMVTTQDEALAGRMRSLCLHGITADAWNRYSEAGNWYYEVTECGLKYNLSDVQSAIGIHQLHRQESFVRRRSRLAAIYRQELEALDGLELPPERMDCRHAWHLYAVRVRPSLLTVNRGGVIRELRARGIGASVHFIPIPLHPAYASYPTLRGDLCPRAMDLYQQLISLPIYPDMTDGQAGYVARTLRGIVTRARRVNVAAGTSGGGEG